MRQPVIGRAAQPARRGINPHAATGVQTRPQRLPRLLREPGALVNEYQIDVERTERIAVCPRGPEIEDRAVRVLDFEVGLADDLLALLGVDRDARLKVGIAFDLELHFLDDGVERALMRRGHQHGIAAPDESLMKRESGQTHAFPHASSIKVNNVSRVAFEIVRLVRPVAASAVVAVAKIALAPLPRAAQDSRDGAAVVWCFLFFQFIPGNPGPRRGTNRFPAIGRILSFLFKNPLSCFLKSFSEIGLASPEPHCLMMTAAGHPVSRRTAQTQERGGENHA